VLLVRNFVLTTVVMDSVLCKLFLFVHNGRKIKFWLMNEFNRSQLDHVTVALSDFA